VLVALVGRRVEEPGGVDGVVGGLEEGLAAAGVALAGPGGQRLAASPQDVENHQIPHHRAFQGAGDRG